MTPLFECFKIQSRDPQFSLTSWIGQVNHLPLLLGNFQHGTISFHLNSSNHYLGIHVVREVRDILNSSKVYDQIIVLK